VHFADSRNVSGKDFYLQFTLPDTLKMLYFSAGMQSYLVSKPREISKMNHKMMNEFSKAEVDNDVLDHKLGMFGKLYNENLAIEEYIRNILMRLEKQDSCFLISMILYKSYIFRKSVSRCPNNNLEILIKTGEIGSRGETGVELLVFTSEELEAIYTIEEEKYLERKTKTFEADFFATSLSIDGN
jgi:hypothetical protein